MLSPIKHIVLQKVESTGKKTLSLTEKTSTQEYLFIDYNLGATCDKQIEKKKSIMLQSTNYGPGPLFPGNIWRGRKQPHPLPLLYSILYTR